MIHDGERPAMLKVLLVGFLAVVAGIVAAEGLIWAMRVHPEGRSERLRED